MAKYNTGKKYNFPVSNGGFLYNSAIFIVKIKLFETIRASENLGGIVAKNILKESFYPFEEVVQYALHEFLDEFEVKDDVEPSVLFQISEKLGFQERLGEVLVELYLKENAKILDQFRLMEASIMLDEKFYMKEVQDIGALVHIAEKLKLPDAAKILAQIEKSEYAKVTDGKPRTAISDFLIGYSDTLDKSYEWFLPLEMLIDAGETQLQVMPEAENTYVEMPYVDGTAIESTVYKNRLFNIVAWSKQGLTVAQKEQLKYEITQILDSTKKSPKKLTLQKTGTSFDVKYSGKLEMREGPSFVKATIPLELPPYGYPLFDQELFGSGLLINDGDADVGFVTTIGGGCVNPLFEVGNITYSWNGTVPINQKLVINQEDMTCYLEDFDGKKVNALDRLTGDFQKIPKATTLQLNASAGTKDYIKTVVKTKILWKKG